MVLPPKTILLLRFWLPVIAWAAVIFLFSSKPTGVASQIYWEDFIVKKFAHIVEYAIFATLIFRALVASGTSRKYAAILALIISICYAATDEIHQSFTPGREPRARDVIFDTIGASTAIYSIWNIIPKAPKKLKLLAKDFQLI